MAKPVPQAAASVVYPDSDGKPVESKQHYQVAHYVMSAFHARFGDSADYASNHGFYYEEGNPKKVVVPDVYWVADKPFNIMLRTYLLWEEGRVPNFVLELASAFAKKRDAEKKRKLYARLGVKDYFRFDPVGGVMTPKLQGLRLEAGAYKPVPAVALLDGGSSVCSEELKLELRAWGIRPRHAAAARERGRGAADGGTRAGSCGRRAPGSGNRTSSNRTRAPSDRTRARRVGAGERGLARAVGRRAGSRRRRTPCDWPAGRTLTARQRGATRRWRGT